jgi:hypothetical protein
VGATDDAPGRAGLWRRGDPARGRRRALPDCDFLRGFGGSYSLRGGGRRDCLLTTDGVGGNDVDCGDSVTNAEQVGSCPGD